MTKELATAPGCKAAASDRLTPLLRQSAELVEWGDADWDLAIRQARHAGLTARVEAQLRACNMLREVPAAPAAHLEAARIVADKHQVDVAREIRAIAEALAPLAVPIILL